MTTFFSIKIILYKKVIEFLRLQVHYINFTTGCQYFLFLYNNLIILKIPSTSIISNFAPKVKNFLSNNLFKKVYKKG
ncbi:hypothetical protein [Staphylococcus phage vB_SauM-V1SA09]|nr:hypothetical protein [Staphylococcus phage vB_SauM-V1SA09]